MFFQQVDSWRCSMVIALRNSCRFSSVFISYISKSTGLMMFNSSGGMLAMSMRVELIVPSWSLSNSLNSQDMRFRCSCCTIAQELSFILGLLGGWSSRTQLSLPFSYRQWPMLLPWLSRTPRSFICGRKSYLPVTGSTFSFWRFSFTFSTNLEFFISRNSLCLAQKLPLSRMSSQVTLLREGLNRFQSWYLHFLSIFESNLALSAANFWLMRFIWGSKVQLSISCRCFLFISYCFFSSALLPYSIKYCQTGKSFLLPSAITLLILLISGRWVSSASSSSSLSFLAFSLMMLRQLFLMSAQLQSLLVTSLLMRLRSCRDRLRFSDWFNDYISSFRMIFTWIGLSYQLFLLDRGVLGLGLDLNLGRDWVPLRQSETAYRFSRISWMLLERLEDWIVLQVCFLGGGDWWAFLLGSLGGKSMMGVSYGQDQSWQSLNQRSSKSFLAGAQRISYLGAQWCFTEAQTQLVWKRLGFLVVSCTDFLNSCPNDDSRDCLSQRWEGRSSRWEQRL